MSPSTSLVSENEMNLQQRQNFESCWGHNVASIIIGFFSGMVSLNNVAILG